MQGVSKKNTQLENDVLADLLGVRGSNLVQKERMNAENGVRPKERKEKVGTSRKNTGTSRKSTLNWKMTSCPIPWELELKPGPKERYECRKWYAAQKKKKKSRNVPKKRRDVPKKHTQLENDVLAHSLGVRG